MAYVVDRDRALRAHELVAVLNGQARRGKHRVVLTDNSLYDTLTQPRTLRRYAKESHAAVGGIGELMVWMKRHVAQR